MMTVNRNNEMMRIIGFILLMISYSANSLAQCVLSDDSLNDQRVYLKVDQMPRYPGGEGELLQYIHLNFKPTNNESFIDKYYLEFIIDSSGNILEEKIKNKPLDGLRKDETEILQILKKTKWIPGKCNGVNVNVKFFLPLT